MNLFYIFFLLLLYYKVAVRSDDANPDNNDAKPDNNDAKPDNNDPNQPAENTTVTAAENTTAGTTTVASDPTSSAVSTDTVLTSLTTPSPITFTRRRPRIKKILDTRATRHVSYRTMEPPPSKEVTVFVKRIKEKMCYLRPERGPCRADIKMYYFHPKTMQCDTFDWGGCQGNGNRFDTRQECRKICVKGADDDRLRPYYCSLAYDYGYCFGSTKRYHYDKLTESCTEVIYSGCGGNNNNFVSRAECERECMTSIPRRPRKRPERFRYNMTK